MKNANEILNLRKTNRNLCNIILCKVSILQVHETFAKCSPDLTFFLLRELHIIPVNIFRPSKEDVTKKLRLQFSQFPKLKILKSTNIDLEQLQVDSSIELTRFTLSCDHIKLNSLQISGTKLMYFSCDMNMRKGYNFGSMYIYIYIIFLAVFLSHYCLFAYLILFFFVYNKFSLIFYFRKMAKRAKLKKYGTDY